MAIIVELHHDEDGIIWPASVAPYQVHLLHLGKGDDVREAADRPLRSSCKRRAIEVLYDDRELSAGVKFKDADLIGIPWRVDRRRARAGRRHGGSKGTSRNRAAERAPRRPRPVSTGLTHALAGFQPGLAHAHISGGKRYAGHGFRRPRTRRQQRPEQTDRPGDQERRHPDDRTRGR